RMKSVMASTVRRRVTRATARTQSRPAIPSATKSRVTRVSISALSRCDPLYPAYVICDTARITRGSGQRESEFRSVPDDRQVRVTGLAAVPPAPRYGESDIGAFRVDLIPGHHAPESRSTR